MTSKKFQIILLSILIIMGITLGIFLFSEKYKNVNGVLDQSILISEESPKPTAENIFQKEISELPGCITAFNPIDETFSKSKNIKNEAKTALQNYRTAWQDICSGKSERSLYPLWIEAKKLTELKSDFEYRNRGLCDSREELEGDCYPIISFTPGIEGLYAEGMLVDFTPSQKLFAKNATIGTLEDKDFFETFTSLNIDNSNNFPPWIDPTWDYGGCTRYGSYNWIKTLNTLDNLSKKIKNPGYLEEINLHRSHLLTGVTSHLLSSQDSLYKNSKPSVCTCDKKEDVLSDLENISSYAKNHLFYFESNTTMTNQSLKIDDLISNIKNGKIDIFSQSERHCSGG